MRKASKILYLIAGIVGIATFVLFIILGLVTLVAGIMATDPEVVAQAGITQEKALEAQAVGIGFSIFLLIAAVVTLVGAIVGFIARKGGKNVLALVFGIIGMAAFGTGAFLLIGGILGVVADKQGQPA